MKIVSIALFIISNSLFSFSYATDLELFDVSSSPSCSSSSCSTVNIDKDTSDHIVRQKRIITVDVGSSNQKRIKLDQEVCLINLPPEILHQIFIWLNFEDFDRCSQTNKYLRQVCRSLFLTPPFPDFYRNLLGEAIQDYQEDEEINKALVANHFLMVKLNTVFDMDHLSSLISKYKPNYRVPYFNIIFQSHCVMGWDDDDEELGLPLYIQKYILEEHLIKKNSRVTGNYISSISQVMNRGNGIFNIYREKLETAHMLYSKGRPVRHTVTYAGGCQIHSPEKLTEEEIKYEEDTHGWTPEAINSGLDWQGWLASPEYAHQLNEELVQQNDQSALNRKCVGLQNGQYGYLRDQLQMEELNEKLIAMDNPQAYERKIMNCHDRGKALSIDQQWSTTRKYNDVFCRAELEGWGEERHYPLFERGKQEMTPRFAYEIYEDLMTRSHLGDVGMVIEAYFSQYNMKGPYVGPFRNKSDINSYLQTRELIEQKSNQGVRIFQYCKAFGLKYGVWYKKDLDAAKAYILKHHIAF
jgi:hypothetical protein